MLSQPCSECQRISQCQRQDFTYFGAPHEQAGGTALAFQQERCSIPGFCSTQGRASCVAALVDSIIRHMIGYVKFTADGDKNRKLYHCSYCGAFIAESGAIVTIQGAGSHSFVNPAGVLCNFTTFSDCENVMVLDALYLQHSWFRGYGWRFVLCAKCHHHLGWKYDAVQEGIRPRSFFGVLVESVDSLPDDG